jgi:hypothetical protein
MSSSDSEGDGPAKETKDFLSDVEPSRRDVLRRLVVGAAVATPIVSSFSISGLGLKSAYAADAPLDITCTLFTPTRRHKINEIKVPGPDCPPGYVKTADPNVVPDPV